MVTQLASFSVGVSRRRIRTEGSGIAGGGATAAAPNWGSRGLGVSAEGWDAITVGKFSEGWGYRNEIFVETVGVGYCFGGIM